MNSYNHYLEDNDEINFWEDIYLDNDYIIPEKQYNQMLKEDRKIGESNSEEDYIDSGNGPELISSTYGSYYIPYHFKSSSGSLNDTEILRGLAGEADIVPVEAYHAALVEEMKNEEEARKWRLKYIAMGYEGYYNVCETNFINNMERLSENGITIADIKLSSISQYDSYHDSQLDYDLMFEVDGTIVKGLGIGIWANHGKINFNSTYTRIGSEGEKLDVQYHITSAFLFKD